MPYRPDWDEAYLAATAEDEDPGDADLYEDPDNAPPAGLDDAEMATLIAEARENAEERARADADAAARGMTGLLAMIGAVGAVRRGPGMPGSAESFPGDSGSRAAGFASGKPLDTAPGRVTLTIPAVTLLDLADRPGEMGGSGPIDPDPGANT